MTAPTPTQAKLLMPMADYVLENGLQTASLRPLAKAAGTSDRMLIYHFDSKDALLGHIMRFIAEQMATGLATTLSSTGPMPAHTLLTRVWDLAQRSEMRRTLRIWLELTSMAARGDDTTQAVAQDIADRFLDWTAAHLKTPTLAPVVLTHFEGLVVLQEAGRADVANQSLAALKDILGER